MFAVCTAFVRPQLRNEKETGKKRWLACKSPPYLAHCGVFDVTSMALTMGMIVILPRSSVEVKKLFTLTRIMGFISPTSFLDATTHLYKRWCPSVGRSVGPSVGLSRVIFERRKSRFLRLERLQMTNSNNNNNNNNNYNNSDDNNEK